MKIATVAFSGGLDSTAALHKMVTRGNYDLVTAHHVKLLTREGADRVQREKGACRQIFYWFQSAGIPFKYTESEYECLFDTHSNTPDIVMVAPMVTQALLNAAQKVEANIYEVAGYEVVPTELHIIYGDHATEFARPAFVGRWNLMTDLVLRTLKEATEGWADQPYYTVLAPNMYNTKKENYEYLPEDLRKLTTSCRKGSNCGNCNPCLEIEAIEASYVE